MIYIYIFICAKNTADIPGSWKHLIFISDHILCPTDGCIEIIPGSTCRLDIDSKLPTDDCIRLNQVQHDISIS